MVLTSSGELISAGDNIEDHLTSPHWFLYSLAPCSPLTKLHINIPDLVKVALTDTKRSLQDYHQKKMFIEGEESVKEMIVKTDHQVITSSPSTTPASPSWPCL